MIWSCDLLRQSVEEGIDARLGLELLLHHNVPVLGIAWLKREVTPVWAWNASRPWRAMSMSVEEGIDARLGLELLNFWRSKFLRIVEEGTDARLGLELLRIAMAVNLRSN